MASRAKVLRQSEAPNLYRIAFLAAFFLVLLMAATVDASAEPRAAKRTITVSGEAELSARPDIATINAGVVSEAPTAAAALKENSAKMNAVFDGLKKMGIAEKDMQTSQFDVSPVQNYNRNNDKPPEITGYRVTNEVFVRVRDLDSFGSILDEVVTLGANRINSINFGIDDHKKLYEQVQGDAVKNAMDKAKRLAEAAGVTLGPVMKISEGGRSSPQPVYRMAAMAMDESAGAPPPVAAGEQTVTASVSLVIAIE